MKTKVFCAFPSTGNTVTAQIYALRQIAEKYQDVIELVYPKDCAYRIFHDHARNGLTEDFLASDCDIMWMLDSDICPPLHVLDLITQTKHEWEAAGACYPIFLKIPGVSNDQPVVQFTAYKGILEGQGIMLSSVPRSGMEFVDGLATGCMFLKRSVFSKLKKPYFEFKYEPESRRMIEGEDLGFCLKLNKLGIKFLTDYSMVCKHYKTVCLLDVNNYAVEHANNQVISYDSEIRTKIDAAIKAAYKSGFMDGRDSAMQGERPSGLVIPGKF